jgi:hypothetical protein
VNNLAYQYHISGAVKSAVAYVLDGSVNGASSVPKVAPSVVHFEKYLLAASSLVLIFSKKAGFSLTKVNKVADSVQHSH